MNRNSEDFFLDGYGFSQFFELTASSEYLARLYHIRYEAVQSYCFDLSALQDSFRFRALHRARAIAASVIDDRGELRRENLERIVHELKNNGYIFYPDGLNDSVLTEHALRVLTRFLEEERMVKAIKRFGKFMCHAAAERLVLDTLGLFQEKEVTLAHVRRAVLTACLTPLRQSVGSCFASAPAILIQRDHLDLFLDDLHQLLTTGKLKRTFGGNSYAVPLSPNVGTRDVRRNFFSLDPKAHLHYSPGLRAACELLELIPVEIPDAKKAEILQQSIAALAKDKQKMTVEELLRAIVLEQMGTVLHAEEFTFKLNRAKAAFLGICDNALLKAWEYTLASLCDVKMEFSRWNLYASLGFSSDAHGGIGELLYKHIDEKLQLVNEKIQNFQQESQAAFDAAKATEALLRNAGSEAEARRLQAEYQARSYHMQACLNMRDDLYAQGEHYSKFFAFLLDQYSKVFAEYFQEIYDPNLVASHVDPHQDSLAGFRLIYKHGRADPSLWTAIYDAQQFIEALSDFFSAVESRISAEISWEEGKKELSAITTTLLNHLRTDLFLQSALQRASPRKPWSYLSGGTVDTLLKTYFSREQDFTKEDKKFETETELLNFIVDLFKGLIPRVTEPYLKDAGKGMLMTSPSHAFLLLPGMQKLCEGWQENGFTYTWVRDQVFAPSHHFYAQMQLSQTQQIFLLDAFCAELPPMLRHDFYRVFHADPTAISVPTFRQKVLEGLMSCARSAHKQTLAEGLDGFLFQTLPIVSGSDWKLLVKQLLSDLYDDACRDFLYPFNHAPCAYMSAKQIKDLAKMTYVHSRRTLFSSFDVHQYIADHARFIGLAPPSSFVIADTNWANQYFGYVVNPGTAKLELWSVDRTASQGTPMSEWKSWFSPENPNPWVFYVQPGEYSAISTTALPPHYEKV
jgi:hypothetical protein